MTEALRAVEAEAKAPAEGVLVPLVTDDQTVDILVPPASEWFEGAVEALTSGRIADWVDLALEGDELAKWRATRKRYRHINDFFGEWSKRSGEDAGKSPRSTSSSKTTRKR